MEYEPPAIDEPGIHDTTCERSPKRNRKRTQPPQQAVPDPQKQKPAVKHNVNCDFELIKDIRATQKRLSISQVDIMRASGISNTVLCDWLQAKYKGNVERVNKQMRDWVEKMKRYNSHDDLPLFLKCDTTHIGRAKQDECVTPIHIHLMFTRNPGEGLMAYTEDTIWDISEHRLSPTEFAKSVCIDNGLPKSCFRELLAQVESQIYQAKARQKNVSKVGTQTGVR